jgi:hypothetical protein
VLHHVPLGYKNNVRMPYWLANCNSEFLNSMGRGYEITYGYAGRQLWYPTPRNRTRRGAPLVLLQIKFAGPLHYHGYIFLV